MNIYSKTVYEALPLVYSICGILALIVLEHSLGIFSGLLLIATALLVWGMRFNYRRYTAHY